MPDIIDADRAALAEIALGGWTWSAAPPHWRDAAGRARDDARLVRLVRLALIDANGDPWRVTGAVALTAAGRNTLAAAPEREQG
jgi:hypothetical protein